MSSASSFLLLLELVMDSTRLKLKPLFQVRDWLLAFWLHYKTVAGFDACYGINRGNNLGAEVTRKSTEVYYLCFCLGFFKPKILLEGPY